jgi:PIN domain nuclease of toxin-antitoxin system
MGSVAMIVLDTHTWVWWVNGQPALSQRGQRAIRKAASEAAVYISSISVWEVAQLVAKGRLELTMDVESWVRKSEAMPFLHFISVDNAIAMKSVQLSGPFHGDPADRIIVATSIILGFPLITRDRRILDYADVKSFW